MYFWKSNSVHPAADKKTLENEIRRGISDDFYVIFTAASLIGLPLYPTSLSSNSRLVCVLLTIWCSLMTAIKTVWIELVIVFNNHLWTSDAVRMCSLVHCLVGYALTWVIILKGYDVVEVVMELRKLLTIENPPDVRIQKSCIPIYMFLNFLFVFVFTWISAEFSLTIAFNSLSNNIKEIVPFHEESVLFGPFNWLVIFSVVISYCMSTATLHIATLLYAHLYRCFAQLLMIYGQKLRSELACTNPTHVKASKCLVLFKDIQRSIDFMDRSINAGAFLIYVAVVNGVYNFLSLTLSQDVRFVNPVADCINFMIMTSSSTMLFYLSLSGDHLKVESDTLKRMILEYSYLILKPSTDNVTVLKFELLFQNIRYRNPCATGLDLFDITKKIIPTVFGVIVSYFMLIYQLGATADS